MDPVFQHLIQRATPQPESKVGTPWQCIPIKNDKQARDTNEVHLANQGITELKDFDKFMNVEVIWLNNNQLTKVDNLDRNFRVKQLYLQDNKIRTLEGSISIMKHLETLIVSNNELRDLQKNLDFLEDFPYLKQLDLFDNPLAEEPNYRYRVIHQLPQLILLDRHIITLEERRKAEKWASEDKIVRLKKKGPPKAKLPPSQIYSKGEKDLYREVKQIKERKQQEQEEEERKQHEWLKSQEKTFDPDKLPTNQLREELKRRRQEDPLSIITEWEKGRLKKIFKSYDKDKKGIIGLPELENVYNDLLQDKALLGKVPSMELKRFIEIMRGEENSETVSWNQFNFNLNHVFFCRAPEDILKKRIDTNYYEFNKKINTGKIKEGRELLFDGIRLENARDMEETQKHLMRKSGEIEVVKRNDYYDFQKQTYRMKFSDTAKYIL